jgi:hypothetical protein
VTEVRTHIDGTRGCIALTTVLKDLRIVYERQILKKKREKKEGSPHICMNREMMTAEVQ